MSIVGTEYPVRDGTGEWGAFRAQTIEALSHVGKVTGEEEVKLEDGRWVPILSVPELHRAVTGQAEAPADSAGATTAPKEPAPGPPPAEPAEPAEPLIPAADPWTLDMPPRPPTPSAVPPTAPVEGTPPAEGTPPTEEEPPPAEEEEEEDSGDLLLPDWLDGEDP